MIKPKKQKTDRKELAELAEALLDLEMEKPASERDDALADELAKTVLYEREQLAAENALGKAAESCGEKRRSSAPGAWKKLAVAAATLLLVFCLGASVAQAAGVRVWSAIVHWDANYLRLDYSGGTPQKKTSPTTTIEYLEFSSPEELKARFGEQLLLPAGAEGLEFISAYAQVVDQKSALVDIRLTDGGEPVSVRCSLSLADVPDDEIRVSSLLVGKYTEVYQKAVGSTDCIFAFGEGDSLASFASGHDVYTVRANGSRETVEKLTAALLGIPDQTH